MFALNDLLYNFLIAGIEGSMVCGLSTVSQEISPDAHIIMPNSIWYAQCTRSQVACTAFWLLFFSGLS